MRGRSRYHQQIELSPDRIETLAAGEAEENAEQVEQSIATALKRPSPFLLFGWRPNSTPPIGVPRQELIAVVPIRMLRLTCCERGPDRAASRIGRTR